MAYSKPRICISSPSLGTIRDIHKMSYDSVSLVFLLAVWRLIYETIEISLGWLEPDWLMWLAERSKRLAQQHLTAASLGRICRQWTLLTGLKKSHQGSGAILPSTIDAESLEGMWWRHSWRSRVKHQCNARSEAILVVWFSLDKSIGQASAGYPNYICISSGRFLVGGLLVVDKWREICVSFGNGLSDRE